MVTQFLTTVEGFKGSESAALELENVQFSIRNETFAIANKLAINGVDVSIDNFANVFDRC